MKRKVKEKIVIFFIGLFAFLCILEIGLRIVGRIHLNRMPSVKKSLEESKTKQYQILCIGDSFTEGIGAFKNGGYPNQLENLLNSNYENPRFDVINSGKGGKNTTQVIDILKRDLKEIKPDIVIFLAGVQNLWNFSGYNRYFTNQSIFSKIRNYLYELRLYKLVKVLFFYVKKKLRKGTAIVDNMENYGSYLKKREIDRIKKSDYKATVRRLKKKIKILDNTVGEVKRLEDYYNNKNNRISALSQFENALRREIKSAKLYFKLASCYRRHGEFKKAEKIYKRSIELISNKSNIKRKLNKLHKDPTEIKRKLENIDTLIFKSRNGVAKTYQSQGKFSKAEKLYKKILSGVSKPERCKIHERITYCCIKQKKYKEAKKWSKRTIKLFPYYWVGYYERGNVLLKQKNFPEALKWFRKANKFIPEDTIPLEIGITLLENGQGKKAINWIDIFPEFLFKGIRYYNDISLLAAEQGIWREVISEFKESIRNRSKDSNLYYGLGKVNFQKRDYQSAVKWFKKAVSLNPNKLILYENIAKSFKYDGKLHKAVKWYKKALKHCENDIMSRNYCDFIYKIYLELGMRKSAIKFFRKLSKENPQVVSYLQMLKLKNRDMVKQRAKKWIISDVEKVIELCQEKNIELVLQNYPVVNGKIEQRVSQILKKVANENSVIFVDQYQKFKKLESKSDNIKTYYSPDGHCNGKGYYIMAKKLYNKIVNEDLISEN